MEFTYIDLDFNFNEKNEALCLIGNSLKKYGMSLSNFCGITFSLEYMQKLLAISPNDLVIVRLSEDFSKNIAFKNLLCECFKSFLVKNTACSFAIESYLRLYNGVIDNPENFENESLLPDGAEPLTSDLGFVQGYMMNYKSINICCLPPNLEQIKDILEDRIPNLFNRLYHTPTEFMYLKTFGVSEENLNKMLLPFINNSLNICVAINCNNLDSLISIGYSRNIVSAELNNFVSQVCETLNKYLYSTDNANIKAYALDYLKLTNKNIAIYEEFTKGKIFNSLLNENFKLTTSHVIEHKIISTLGDLSNLESLNKNDIASNGLYRVESVYEIATAMINENTNSLAILSLVDWNERTNTATSFLAIGDNDGVHIYKNVYKGKLETIQDIVVNNTCFYIIKKLKQNNLLFDQTI